MKKIFIYYSNSGNGDIVADYLKRKDFDIRKVKSKFKLSKNLFLSMMKGGFHAFIGSKPKLIGYNNDISTYDEIYIGSPIWNGRLACPTNTILKETDLVNKNLTFILYSGSGDGKKAIFRLLKKYPNARIINLKEPKKYNQELEKIGE